MIPSGNIAADFKQNIGLVHSVSKKGFGWSQALGLPLEYDDLFQDASMAFVKACEGFDVNSGMKFSTYFTTAAMNQFGRTIGVMTGCKTMNKAERAQRVESKAKRKLSAERGEAPEIGKDFFGLSVMRFGDMNNEEGGEISDSFMSDIRSPEQIVAAREEWTKCEKRLSPLARTMAVWLLDPPDELIAEMEARKAHAEYGRSLGFDPRLRQEVCLTTICEFLVMSGESRNDVYVARKELMGVIDKVTEE